jgi:hypothetical protein
MMSAYLMIENPGICPPEGFTILGVSLADTCQNDGIIGQFGSGNKHSVMLCLRKGLQPTVFCGNLKLEFFTKPYTVQDSRTSKNFARVCVKYSGRQTRTEDLGFVLDYGKKDWDDIALALREFVSNAIDRCIREHGNWSAMRIKIVDASQVRARAGTTRVFIPLTTEVLDFYNNLGRWFLHFSEPESINQSILPKRDRNLGNRRAAVIYRRGVRVREFQDNDIPSLFDYNLNYLSLDEARKASDWDVRYYCGRALANAPLEVLTIFMTKLFRGELDYWEFGFDNNSFTFYTGNDERSQRWKAAFEAVAGDKAVIVRDQSIAERVRQKGYIPVLAPDAIASAANLYGIPTAEKILTQDEMAGRNVTDATDSAQQAVDHVWTVIERHGLTQGKKKPPVYCFSALLDAGCMLNGYYREGKVYINRDLAPQGGSACLSDRLLKVALEEVAHYVTEATDNSRDFQDYLLNLSVKLLA